MSDVLEIEVDGAPPPKGGAEGETGAPSWGMPAAIAVAGVLLLAVIVVVRTAPQPVASSASPASSVPSTRLPSDTDDEIFAAAGAAMSAWGQFAVTGDVALLDAHFHSAGPQYRQLVAEAPTIADVVRHGGPYEVATTGSVSRLSVGRAEVRATVVWQRPGEPDQRTSWIIEMRRSPDGAWMAWTVRSAGG